MTIEKLMEVYVERGKKERLRDEFAMAAMREVGWHSDKDKSARLAYEIADAMLRAREVKP